MSYDEFTQVIKSLAKAAWIVHGRNHDDVVDADAPRKVVDLFDHEELISYGMVYEPEIATLVHTNLDKLFDRFTPDRAVYNREFAAYILWELFYREYTELENEELGIKQ